MNSFTFLKKNHISWEDLLEKQSGILVFFRGRSGSLTDEARLQLSPRRHHNYHHVLHNSTNDTSSELLKLLKR